jgi:hypothetical protein
MKAKKLKEKPFTPRGVGKWRGCVRAKDSSLTKPKVGEKRALEERENECLGERGRVDSKRSSWNELGVDGAWGNEALFEATTTRDGSEVVELGRR